MLTTNQVQEEKQVYLSDNVPLLNVVAQVFSTKRLYSLVVVQAPRRSGKTYFIDKMREETASDNDAIIAVDHNNNSLRFQYFDIALFDNAEYSNPILRGAVLGSIATSTLPLLVIFCSKNGKELYEEFKFSMRDITGRRCTVLCHVHNNGMFSWQVNV